MKVKIKRIDKTLPLPEYKTAGAVAFDLMSRTDVVVEPKSIAYIPLNVALEPLEGCLVMLAARSSLHKKGLMLANGVGIIDQDFCGNEDEYCAAVYNFTDEVVAVARGERIVQGVFKPYEKVEWEEVDDLKNQTRGGFGTTGN